MATPKVSITFDADLSALKKATADAEKSVVSFEDSVLNFSKKTAAAFAVATAAAAAYATKLVVDGVKSAIEDEAAQLRLASALKTATGATDNQIKATEDYISKTSLATGMADDKLRPAFQKLAVATGDVTKSQEILNLAIDVSRGTGVDLESIVTQLSKAYAGQDAGLAKLGIGITATEAKTMSFKDETQKLTDLWGGAASRSSDTLSVKLEIMKNRFNEAKESVGVALLPILTRLADYIVLNVVPTIEAFVAGLTGNKSLVSGFKDSELAAYNFGERAKSLIGTLIGLKEEISAVGVVLGLAFGAAAVIGGISTLVNAIKTLIIAYNALKASAIVAGVASYFALNPAAGVAATGVAAAVLLGATALANQSNVSTDFNVGGSSFTYGSGNPQFDMGSIGGTGGGFTGGGVGGGGSGAGGGGTSIPKITGIGSVDALNSAFDAVTKGFQELDFKLSTNQITTKAALSEFNRLSTEFDRLTNISKGVGELGVPSMVSPSIDYTTPFLGAQASPGQTIINLRVEGAIDSEGTARTIVGALNDSFYRGTEGSRLLAGLR
jgi:hypothetical protein